MGLWKVWYAVVVVVVDYFVRREYLLYPGEVALMSSKYNVRGTDTSL